MRLRNRNIAIGLMAAAFALPAVSAEAQQVKKPAAEKAGAPKKDPNAALKALETASKAYDSGKLDPAIEGFTAALANGGLPPDKMARAYYYRGLAYKKQKKPAQALSDLTVAVWVNGGLNETDKASAMQARNDVYREAGLGDQAPPIANAVAPAAPAAGATAAAKPAAAVPAPAPTPEQPVAEAAPVAPPAPPVSAPAVTAAPSGPAATGGERPVWQAEADSKPAAVSPADAAPAMAAAPPPPPAPSPSKSAPASDAYVPPVPATTATLAAAPEAAPAQSTDTLAPLAKAGDSISGFFSNMFGESSPPPAPPPTVTTGSTTEAASDAGWVQTTGAGAASRPTGPSAQVSASEPQRAPGYEVAAVAPQPSATPPPAASARTARSANGKYRLQLAPVRSKDEADRLVQTLMSSHAEQLGGAEAMVDETVIGNMGTFYRVRLGPYADANEPKKVCSALKPQGFDCQVVTQ